jgi:hypothetical protein
MHLRPLRTTLPSVLAATLLVGTMAVAAVAPAGATTPPPARFSTPSSIASIGSWIAVTNRATSTLTLLAVSTGAYVRTVSHTTLGVATPTSIAATTIGGKWYAFVGAKGGRVSELAIAADGTTASVTRVDLVRAHGCGSGGSTMLALDTHGHLLAACTNGTISVWSAATLHLVRTITPSTSKLTDVGGIAVQGAAAYLTNDATKARGAAPDGITELSITTGHRLRSVTNATNAAYAFSTPVGISSEGTNLWVANEAGNTVDELAAGSLAFLGSSGTNLTAPAVVLATPTKTWVSSASVDGSSSMVTQFVVVNHEVESTWMMCNSNDYYHFDDPSGFAIHAGMLWVSNSVNSLIDQMNETTGALVRTYT